jgi:hypothetical protein
LKKTREALREVKRPDNGPVSAEKIREVKRPKKGPAFADARRSTAAAKVEEMGSRTAAAASTASTAAARKVSARAVRATQTPKVAPNLRSLQTIYPQGVNSVSSSSEWEEIELAVDSGATETVVGEDMLTSVETVEGEAFKRGVEYEVASGTTIPNLGEKCFVAIAEEGQRRKMRAQVCAVNKALLSVSRMVQAGNRVVFEQNGSYVEDLQSGEKMYMYEKGGMYMLKMWVEKSF